MTVNCEDGRLELSFLAIEADASQATAVLHAAIARLGLPDHKVNDVKIAVAEAINNVVEHAYSGLAPGFVRVKGTLYRDHLEFRIWDAGRPLPGLRVPDGIPASVETGIEDLPEGGFGWFMIRKLTDRVRYDRRRGKNRLLLSFKLRETATWPQ